jgi:hypothetical protein
MRQNYLGEKHRGGRADRLFRPRVAGRPAATGESGIRDTGLLHSLLTLSDHEAVLRHPIVGYSWEGFALEQVQRITPLADSYFWATYGGAELDLYFEHRGRAREA